MMSLNVEIELITPLFSYGADNKSPARPEIRVPSIRGVLRWWTDALLKGNELVDLWGGVSNQNAKASRIIVRLDEVRRRDGVQKLLPHSCDHQSPKVCVDSGSRFRLVFQERLRILSSTEKDRFMRVVKAWLLMGTFGSRSNRGAGSFKWMSDNLSYPSSADAYEREIAGVIIGSQLQAALLPSSYERAEEARIVVSDTISGGCGNNALGSVRPERVSSPLKFRIVSLEGAYRIVAVWDGRGRASLGRVDLKEAIDALDNHGKEIGRVLKDSSLYNWAKA